jgi:hypothetical protein
VDSWIFFNATVEGGSVDPANARWIAVAPTMDKEKIEQCTKC